MNNFKKEFFMNHWLIFFIIIVSSSIMFISGYVYKNMMLEKKHDAELNLRSIKEKYYLAQDKMLLFSKYSNDYQKVRKAGLFNTEDRLNWLSIINAVCDRIGISLLKMNISTRQNISNPDVINSYPDLDIFYSEMDLTISLLHEADLFVFLDAVKSSVKGNFDVYSCSLIKNFININNVIKNKKTNNINVSCKIAWLGLEHKGV